LEKLPLVTLAAAASVVTCYVQLTQGAVADLTKYSASVRVANAAVSYVEYLSKTLWPVGLALYYPHPGANLATWKVAGAALFLTAVTVVAVALRRRAPYLLAGWLWYVGTLVPVIGLVQVGTQAYADRYTYFPQIGILLALCWGAADLSVRHARVALAAVVAAAVALAVVTLGQLEFWRDSVTLWSHTILAAGKSPESLQNLARALEDGGPEARASAARAYEEALKLDPDSVPGLTNFGRLLGLMGRQEEAIKHLKRACDLRPDYAVAHALLGDFYFQQGKLDDAEREQQTAIQLAPNADTAYYGLGQIELVRGNVAGAIEHYREALRLRPAYPEAHCALAKALLSRGEKGEAVAHLEMAISRNPGLAEAQFLLGKQLLAAGQSGPAVAHLTQAVLSGPAPWEAYFVLGRELARLGDLRSAEAHLDRAVRLNPRSAEAWDCLGMTRVGLTKIDSGRDCVETALKLDPHSAVYQSDLALGLLCKPEPLA
jgi:tetratricopeptide (TPR) repeat protein